MYTDFPKLTRCCFCVPLRHGLQVWGYAKLLLETSLLILILLNTWANVLENLINSSLGFVLLILATDIIFSIFLVIATHKKHEKFFKYYYIYSIVLVVMILCACVADLVFMLIRICYYYNDSIFGQMFLEVTIVNAVTIIGLTVLQLYIIMLVRTEMHKLRDNSNIQFINHTSDPQVNMTIEKIIISD